MGEGSTGPPVVAARAFGASSRPRGLGGNCSVLVHIRNRVLSVGRVVPADAPSAAGRSSGHARRWAANEGPSWRNTGNDDPAIRGGPLCRLRTGAYMEGGGARHH